YVTIAVNKDISVPIARSHGKTTITVTMQEEVSRNNANSTTQIKVRPNMDSSPIDI
ncbi:6528_t:CDS:1, partial [Ambispora gerdemannii]